MRYRPASTVPGRKRPSSTLTDEWESGAGAAAAAVTNAVSADVASSAAAHHPQNRAPTLSRPHDGHLTMVAIDQPIVPTASLGAQVARSHNHWMARPYSQRT
jgi:hypothetical protein